MSNLRKTFTRSQKPAKMKVDIPKCQFPNKKLKKTNRGSKMKHKNIQKINRNFIIDKKEFNKFLDKISTK